MQLSKDTLSAISFPENTRLPNAKMLALPEKVIQFGTGVLLRGLIDYLIDEANQKEIFNGRVLVVKSTSGGKNDEFEQQDGLYTHAIRGIETGKKTDHLLVNSSISRVLSAQTDWSEILKSALNPDIEIIVSNTTEVGISLVEDDVHARPPVSFPGKLLALLYARWQNKLKGFVIVPTELIPDNGEKLKQIVLVQAGRNQLEADFKKWIEDENVFCSSLVDRIVPGKLPDADRNFTYTDELAILSEPYALWAIEEKNPKVKEVLSFEKAGKGVVIAPDIRRFRELKLRMLNGTHTISCGVAVLAGIQTVREGMEDKALSAFIKGFMMEEAAPAISGDLLNLNEARNYGETVLDRFRNPFIHHKWLSITLQYTSKMKMRDIPILLKYYQATGTPPPCFALGFAAYLLFMKSQAGDNGRYYGSEDLGKYELQDDQASYFSELWAKHAPEEVVARALRNQELWGTDLSELAGFEPLVAENLMLIQSRGMSACLETNLQTLG